MRISKSIAFAGAFIVAGSIGARAEAQGATDPEDHFHYLHFEVEDPDPYEQYEDGPAVGEEDDTAKVAAEEADSVTSDESAEALEDAEVVGEEPEETVPLATFDLSGWLWFNYSIQNWRDTTLARYGNFEFNQLQLSGSATWGNFSMRFEIRFFSFMFILRQGWLQYAWEDNAIQLGQVLVPWGRHVFSSNSWWFTLGWYSTLEDDYDYGVKYVRDTDKYRLDIAYLFRDQVGFADPANRWDSDLTPLAEQQNRDVSSLAVRGIYKMPHRPNLYTELIVAAQVGLVPNVATDETGWRYMVQGMFTGNYKGWEPLVQVTRSEFRPQNPAEIDGTPVDDRIVRISQFGGYRDIAAKFTFMDFNLAKTIPFSWKYFNALVPYVEYSLFLKDEADFPTSHLITVGLQVHLGPVWLWLDVLTGKDATYLNDSFANSALGAGANRPNRWENQVNLQIQYYF